MGFSKKTFTTPDCDNAFRLIAVGKDHAPHVQDFDLSKEGEAMSAVHDPTYSSAVLYDGRGIVICGTVAEDDERRFADIFPPSPISL